MGLLSRLRKVAARAVYARRLNRRWANVLAELPVWPLPDASLDENGALRLPRIPLPIAEPTPIAKVLIVEHRLAGDLCARAGAQIRFVGPELEIEVGGIRAAARNRADLLVFHEIFVERLYAFEAPGPFFVLDFGANLGLASLFFAQRYDAEVWAYELVPETAERAQANLSRNPDLAARIRLHAHGVAEGDGAFEIDVDEATHSMNSLVPDPARPAQGRAEVRVRDVGAVAEEALAELKGRRLVVKMDIEGAEYEAVRRLEATGHLGQIDVLFLEWHARAEQDREAIYGSLRRAGFRWFEREHPEAEVGLITALREKADGSTRTGSEAGLGQDAH